MNKHALSAAILGLSGIFMGSVFAQEAKVYLDYTQKQLDHNYSQAEWAPNMKQMLLRYEYRSALTRQQLGAPQRFAYGSKAVEGLNLFRASSSKAPVLIYLHGGAWAGGSAYMYDFPASMLLDKGISYIALDFDNVKTAGLDGMIVQIRSAIAWVYKNADTLNIDAEKIYLAGHSSGAHLGGVALATDWASYGVPANVLKGATLISGMYDLKPVRLSARSSYVPFTDAIEDALSAQRHLDKINTPVILATGSLETDEFKRQSRDFEQALLKSNKPVQRIEVMQFNHFEMMDDYGNPWNPVAAATLRQILNR